MKLFIKLGLSWLIYGVSGLIAIPYMGFWGWLVVVSLVQVGFYIQTMEF